MNTDILIFKGGFGEFVDFQSYSGRLPPEINNIEIEREAYLLSTYELDGKNYLLAHQEPINIEALELAIKHHGPSPMV